MSNVSNYLRSYETIIVYIILYLIVQINSVFRSLWFQWGQTCCESRWIPSISGFGIGFMSRPCDSRIRVTVRVKRAPNPTLIDSLFHLEMEKNTPPVLVRSKAQTQLYPSGTSFNSVFRFYLLHQILWGILNTSEMFIKLKFRAFPWGTSLQHHCDRYGTQLKVTFIYFSHPRLKQYDGK